MSSSINHINNLYQSTAVYISLIPESRFQFTTLSQVELLSRAVDAFFELLQLPRQATAGLSRPVLQESHTGFVAKSITRLKTGTVAIGFFQVFSSLCNDVIFRCDLSKSPLMTPVGCKGVVALHILNTSLHKDFVLFGNLRKKYPKTYLFKQLK